MSDKLIRDELLRSHRYVSVSNDTTKLLFLHLTLASDSLSNAEATTTALSIVMGRQITEIAAATLLAELADHDLVRIYEANGKRYVHIPRSRQRIRYLSGKHPRPPVGVEDSEIKELIAKVGLKSDRGQTQVGPFTPEVEVLLPLKRSVVAVTDKPTKVKTSASGAKAPTAREAKTASVWTAYSTAYETRYQAKPPRNATINAQLAALIARVGAANAPGIAAHYLHSNRGLYVSAKHATALLLRDAEALSTEWLTRSHGTDTAARQSDKRQALGNVFNELIAEEREKNDGQ